MPQSTFYELNSFIVHVGFGLNQGHYFSIIKHKNAWYKLDDEVVKVKIYLFIF